MQIVGIDIGFGFTKACNGREFMVFKSIFGEASEIQYREQLTTAPATDDYLHIETDGKAYFVGELAERQSNVRSFTLDQDQLIGTFAKTMALAALSRLVDRGEPVRVVSGLPISYYRRHRDTLNGILVGKHAIARFDAAGKREEMTLNVTHARIIPQPFGSLFDGMLGNSAEVADKRFVQEKIGIVDVGFRTCDYSIADRTRYSERGSRTTDNGISRAFTLIAAHLRDVTGVNVELYRLYDAVARGSIKIRGRNIDLKPIKEQAFGKLAASIASEAERLWADDWDIDLIVVTGGGGSVLAPYLKPLLQGEVVAAETGVDTRLANVRGYWKYGMHLWSRETRAAAPRS
ncbi:MAG: ParM/StbA family protein [Ectothiorhodospiraceae bacterium]|nr:ParM/StbA family protein [Chromatiales bacterium]MCP5154743.1 ParM/StbA family protein [Ectothiorhodospiraceae bacterium]